MLRHILAFSTVALAAAAGADRPVKETACVIFDVSQPTANVLWELEQVFDASSHRKVLLVVDENLFHAWSASAGADEMLARVQAR